MASQPPTPDYPGQGPIDDPVPSPTDPVLPEPSDPVFGGATDIPEPGTAPLIEGP